MVFPPPLLPPPSPKMPDRIRFPSMIPKPYFSFQVSEISGSDASPFGSEFSLNNSLTSAGFRSRPSSSLICKITATKPATAGHAILVPLCSM